MTAKSSVKKPRRREGPADVKIIIATFDETPVPMLIDITVASMHVVSNQPRAVKYQYASRLADHGALEKTRSTHITSVKVTRSDLLLTQW